ncbi:MAG: hypothetical protein CMH59_10815 [Myxococcales bacterium]|nr:hypothetical protein [Myxococcales bacterium]
MLVGVAVVGCPSSPEPLGVQCDRNTDCQTPYVCRLARCRVECATNRDCRIGSICLKDADGFGACRLPDEAECAESSQCAGILECIEGACTNRCGPERACAPGSSCNESSGCEDLAGRGCVSDPDCVAAGAALRCANDERCREECAADRDCREGTECSDGSCVPITVSLDGGADGGLDAGADGGSDAGGADGGSDASTDAGADDAAIDGATDGGGDVLDGSMDGGALTGEACSLPLMPCGSRPNATVECIDGRCTLTGCLFDAAECDDDYANGCETFVGASVDDCGACGNTCAAGEVCAAGVCTIGSIVQLELGDKMSCARYSTGHVACWGDNRRGGLGNGYPTLGGTGVRPVPGMVAGLTNAIGLTVTADQDSGFDESHACALRSDGTVVCWGSSEEGQIGVVAAAESTPQVVAGISDAVEIASGQDFSCARRAGGTVVCWGSQNLGRLGNGMTTPAAVTTPVEVSGLTGAISLHGSDGAFLCAAVAAGDYRCWGAGNEALGAGAIGTPQPTPIEATALAGLSIEGVRGGTQVNYGVDGSGQVRCWARNSLNGACSDERFMPVAVPYLYTSFSGVAEVAPGGGHAMARLTGGALWCFGDSFDGQCGLGRSESPVDPPEQVSGIDDATLVAAGSQHTCIARASGGVWCAGSNALSQLGNGMRFGTEPSFVRVVGLP